MSMDPVMTRLISIHVPAMLDILILGVTQTSMNVVPTPVSMDHAITLSTNTHVLVMLGMMEPDVIMTSMSAPPTLVSMVLAMMR